MPEYAKPLFTLNWGTEESQFLGMPWHKSIEVGHGDIKKGRAAAAFAHEMAHWQDRDLSDPLNSFDQFYDELFAWKKAIARGLPREEYDEDYFDITLGSYLENVREEYGDGSQEYRWAKQDYNKFIRMHT